MKHFLLFTIIVILSSCKLKTEIDGIRIGNTLVEQQDLSTNKKFTELIHQSTNLNARAFAQLLKFNCGDAAGCYDLGSVIAQVVYKVGEQDFTKMVSNFSKEQKRDIRNYLKVGLEYGYRLENDTPNKSIEEQFPLLYNGLLRQN